MAVMRLKAFTEGEVDLAIVNVYAPTEPKKILRHYSVVINRENAISTLRKLGCEIKLKPGQLIKYENIRK